MESTTTMQRRLHGLLVEAALESRREEAEAEQGEEAGEGTRRVRPRVQ